MSSLLQTCAVSALPPAQASAFTVQQTKGPGCTNKNTTETAIKVLMPATQSVPEPQALAYQIPQALTHRAKQGSSSSLVRRHQATTTESNTINLLKSSGARYFADLLRRRELELSHSQKKAKKKERKKLRVAAASAIESVVNRHAQSQSLHVLPAPTSGLVMNEPVECIICLSVGARFILTILQSFMILSSLVMAATVAFALLLHWT
jgi:hypothetical protein